MPRPPLSELIAFIHSKQFLMRIVADQEIFAVDRIFQSLGDLALLPGRSIARADLEHADALIVRSVLKVDRELLEGTSVRFVGTATSGADHVDTQWLREAGIAFAHARGANASAVAEYCLGALARLLLEGRIDPQARRIGIIGAGAIGSLLAHRMHALDFEFVVCDPPLAEAGQAEFDYQSMAAALDCDIVSLHVPLTLTGRHATAGMLDADAIARLRPGAALLHTSRGGVVDEQALLNRLASGPDLHCVIDVWENEPFVNPALAARATLATPHVAGYSEQAKWKAGLMLARQLAAHFRLPQSVPAASGGSGASLIVQPEWARDEMCHWRVMTNCMRLHELSERFKDWAAAADPAKDPMRFTQEFDRMRKPMLRRQEFPATRLSAAELLTEQQRRQLLEAGFTLQAMR